MRAQRLSTRLFPILLAGALSSAAVGACSDPSASSGDPSGSGAGSQGGHGPDTGCPDDRAFFEANIYAPILAKKCIACHTDEGLAKDTVMVLAPPGDADAIDRSFAAAVAAAKTDLDGTSVLLLRPSGKHPEGHTGGLLIEPGTAEYTALETFVARVTKGEHCDDPGASCTTPEPGHRVLRRLTRTEYDRTIRDLLGIESTFGAAFTADTVVDGFDNNAGALRMTPLLADQVRKAAEEIAAQAFQSPGSLLPCQPLDVGAAACAAQFIESFGKRAFRRPLTGDDKDRYQKLYDLVAGQEGFTKGVEAVLTAMLQSPHFLYRSELGGDKVGDRVNLSSYEIASELSYFIWGSMPDAELFAAAESGALTQPAEIEKHARRLLADPRADEVLARFTEQWLQLDRLATVPKDMVAYPAFNGDVRSAMLEETRRFVRHAVREGSGTLPELLTADYTFLSPELAAFYGVTPPAGAGYSKVTTADPGRVGILGQGSVLATNALPASSSPIHRGKLIRERLLCHELPMPPAGVVVQPPPLDPTKTTRERYEAHATVQPCVSCHRLLDPIGFAFEHFDGVGRYRPDEMGLTIDPTGNIVDTAHTDGAFDGSVELVQKLAESPDVRECYSLQWFRYAYGVEENAALSCMVAQVTDDFTQHDAKIEELIVALTRTPHFVSRVADPGVGTGGGSTTATGAGGGSSSSSSTGAGGAGGMAPTGLDVVMNIDNEWATGYCASVKVTNFGMDTVTWEVQLEIEGTITNIWNATHEAAGAKTKFVGVSYNADLSPQDAASFGFCADK